MPKNVEVASAKEVAFSTLSNDLLLLWEKKFSPDDYENSTGFFDVKKFYLTAQKFNASDQATKFFFEHLANSESGLLLILAVLFVCGAVTQTPALLGAGGFALVGDVVFEYYHQSEQRRQAKAELYEYLRYLVIDEEKLTTTLNSLKIRDQKEIMVRSFITFAKNRWQLE